MNRSALAVATLAALLPVAASAAQSWEDVSTRTALRVIDFAPQATGRPVIVTARLQMQPNTSTAFLMGFVAGGPAQTGVPCVSCVQGAQTGNNIGLTGPYNYIGTGEVAQYTMAFTNVSNTVNCRLKWAITSGAMVIDSFSTVLTGPQPGSWYLLGENRGRPTFSGPALLTGKVTCRGSGSQTTTSHLLFQ